MGFRIWFSKINIIFILMDKDIKRKRLNSDVESFVPTGFKLTDNLVYDKLSE